MPATNQKVSTPRGCAVVIFAVLALFSALCTVFALVVTCAQAWQEHQQKSWPVVTATVDACEARRNSTRGRHRLYIDCTFTYAVHGEINTAELYSGYFYAPEVPQYPANQGAPFYDWLDRHPKGTPIAVRYNPANHSKIVIDSDFYPGGGSRTHDNLTLLAFFGILFLVSFTVAKILIPRKQQPPPAENTPLG
jgi:hypothetical protein